LTEEQLIQELHKILARWNEKLDLASNIQESMRYTKVITELKNNYQISASIQVDPANSSNYILNFNRDV